MLHTYDRMGFFEKPFVKELLEMFDSPLDFSHFITDRVDKLQEDLHSECVERQTRMSEILCAFGIMNSAISERFWSITSAEEASSACSHMQVPAVSSLGSFRN